MCIGGIFTGSHVKLVNNKKITVKGKTVYEFDDDIVFKANDIVRSFFSPEKGEVWFTLNN